MGICSRAYNSDTLSKSVSLPLGSYFSKMRPHILNPSRFICGVVEADVQYFVRCDTIHKSGSEKGALILGAQGGGFVKFVAPAKEGLLDQKRMGA